MSNKKVEVYDDYNEKAVISVDKIQDDTNGKGYTFKVSLDLNPNDYCDPNTFMMYTPQQARQLAASIIAAAEQAEKLAKKSDRI